MTKKQPAHKQTAALDNAYQKEINKAALRIGQNTPSRIAWLLRFGQFDLDALSQGELIDLGHELNYLGDFRFLANETEEASEPTAYSMHDWDGHPRFIGTIASNYLNKIINKGQKVRPTMNRPSLDQIKQLQEFVLGHIINLVRLKLFALELPQIGVCFIPSKRLDAVRVFRVANSPQDLCTHNLAYLLASGAHRIRRCPNCQKVFFADRKNKLHCSSKCQNTAAVKRLRQAASDNKRKKENLPNTSKNPKAKTLKKRGA